MTRERDVDWSDWNGSVGAPPKPKPRPQVQRPAPLKKNKKKMTREDFKKAAEEKLEAERLAEAEMIADSLNKGAHRQATDEELFGHLVVSKDKAEKAEKDWDNTFERIPDLATVKCDHLNKRDELEDAWEDGGSFNDILDPAEVERRDKASLKARK